MDKITFEKTKWACRRGMLELDLFLLPFFENCYESLSENEKGIFLRLLETSDPELYAWLMAHAVPLDMELNALVEKIRRFRFRSPPSHL